VVRRAGTAQQGRGCGGRRRRRTRNAAITWYELAWLARLDPIALGVPVRSWLAGIAQSVRTIDATPAIADTATSLPADFPVTRPTA
jgi:PIN domain nuclease of toxin-antitoxin system